MRLMLALMTTLLVGCGSAGPVRMIDTGCDWVRPIWVSDEDDISPWTARQILRHNETWDAVCSK